MGKFFKIKERGSSVGQELRAGLTTFLAMAYIIAVNPGILVVAGIPLSAAITATCIGAGVMTIGGADEKLDRQGRSDWSSHV